MKEQPIQLRSVFHPFDDNTFPQIFGNLNNRFNQGLVGAIFDDGIHERLVYFDYIDG
jgi:hypothetical protein